MGYLDSSVALHAILPDGDRRARPWLDQALVDEPMWSSALLGLEVTRVMRRDGLDPAGAENLLGRVNLVSLDDDVLQAAGAIERHVKSLDAIHLATCLLLGADQTVISHDQIMLAVAEQLGLAAFDPLSP